MSFDADEIKAAASGHWLGILAHLAPELEPALAKPGRHVPCPVHGGADGFRLFPDVAATGGGVCNTCGAHQDGFSLLMWLCEWGFRETLSRVAETLGLGEDGATAAPPVAAGSQPTQAVVSRSDPDGLRERLQKIWSESAPASGSDVVARYLQGRGLGIRRLGELGTLRFHPELPYYEDQMVIGRYPALVAMVVDAAGNPATLHRTYLTPEGHKAPLPNPKKLMPHPNRLTGGAIPLGEPGPVLGVAEGVETALAVMQATGMPVWSCVSASLLARFEPPPVVETLVVWADKDRSEAGQRAGRELKGRMWGRGIRCRILMPMHAIPYRAKSLDWADVFLEEGAAGFPYPWSGKEVRHGRA
jgi:phage/plasmid primase-like uncharacterized protein